MGPLGDGLGIVEEGAVHGAVVRRAAGVDGELPEAGPLTGGDGLGVAGDAADAVVLHRGVASAHGSALPSSTDRPLTVEGQEGVVALGEPGPHGSVAVDARLGQKVEVRLLTHAQLGHELGVDAQGDGELRLHDGAVLGMGHGGEPPFGERVRVTAPALGGRGERCLLVPEERLCAPQHVPHVVADEHEEQDRQRRMHGPPHLGVTDERLLAPFPRVALLDPGEQLLHLDPGRPLGLGQGGRVGLDVGSGPAVLG